MKKSICIFLALMFFSIFLLPISSSAATIEDRISLISPDTSSVTILNSNAIPEEVLPDGISFDPNTTTLRIDQFQSDQALILNKVDGLKIELIGDVVLSGMLVNESNVEMIGDGNLLIKSLEMSEKLNLSVSGLRIDNSALQLNTLGTIEVLGSDCNYSRRKSSDVGCDVAYGGSPAVMISGSLLTVNTSLYARGGDGISGGPDFGGSGISISVRSDYKYHSELVILSKGSVIAEGGKSITRLSTGGSGINLNAVSYSISRIKENSPRAILRVERGGTLTTIPGSGRTEIIREGIAYQGSGIEMSGGEIYLDGMFNCERTDSYSEICVANGINSFYGDYSNCLVRFLGGSNRYFGESNFVPVDYYDKPLYCAPITMNGIVYWAELRDYHFNQKNSNLFQYYGCYGVFSDENSNLYLWFPKNTILTEIPTSSGVFLGNLTVVENLTEPAVFTGPDLVVIDQIQTVNGGKGEQYEAGSIGGYSFFDGRVNYNWVHVPMSGGKPILNLSNSMSLALRVFPDPGSFVSKITNTVGAKQVNRHWLDIDQVSIPGNIGFTIEKCDLSFDTISIESGTISCSIEDRNLQGAKLYIDGVLMQKDTHYSISETSLGEIMIYNSAHELAAPDEHNLFVSATSPRPGHHYTLILEGSGDQGISAASFFVDQDGAIFTESFPEPELPDRSLDYYMNYIPGTTRSNGVWAFLTERPYLILIIILAAVFVYYLLRKRKQNKNR